MPAFEFGFQRFGLGFCQRHYRVLTLNCVCAGSDRDALDGDTRLQRREQSLSVELRRLRLPIGRRNFGFVDDIKRRRALLQRRGEIRFRQLLDVRLAHHAKRQLPFAAGARLKTLEPGLHVVETCGKTGSEGFIL